MTELMDLAHTLQTLFTHEADDAARQTGFVQRSSPLTGARFVQTLVFGWLHDPDASLDDLAEVAADLGAEVTPQALDKRLNAQASQCLVNLLTAALQRVVTAKPAAVPLLQRFDGVYVFDTTTLSLPAALAALFPGCGGSPGQGLAALKCHVGIELTTGALDLALGAGRQPDVTSELATGPLPAGALRLADRGFFDLQVLSDYTQQGVYWISRLPARLSLYDDAGQKWSLADWLAMQSADRLDVSLAVGAASRLPCRLLAVRLPAAVVAKRQARLVRQAKKKGRKVSRSQEVLCAWHVSITNVPANLLSLAEACVLLAARWQIELLFKLWKSHGGLDRSRGRRASRVLCEVYAKLLAMVVQHWTLLVCVGSCVQWSYPKAARRISRQALRVALSLSVPVVVVEILTVLRQRLVRRCRVQERGERPSTWQRLLAPEACPFAATEELAGVTSTMAA
jgi:hypothetical protein